MIFNKRLCLFLFAILFGTLQVLATTAKAQTCLPPASLQSRLTFLQNQVLGQKKVYEQFKQKHDQAEANLKAMRVAHRLSSISAGISAGAMIYVAGSIGVATLIRGAAIEARVLGVRTIFATRSIATMLTTGEAISISPFIKGMTYFTITRSFAMLPLDGYMIYKDLFGNHENFGESISPQTIENLWMTSDTFPNTAADFFDKEEWKGSSSDLENPKLEKLISSLDEFYQKNLKEIDSGDGIWDYMTEFWTKKQLREYALTKEVMATAMDIQRFRVAYFNMLLTRMKNLQTMCTLHQNEISNKTGYGICE